MSAAADASATPQTRHLGVLGKTAIEVAVSTEPWRLDVEWTTLLLTPLSPTSRFYERFLEAVGLEDRDAVNTAAERFRTEAKVIAGAGACGDGPKVDIANRPIRPLFAIAAGQLDESISKGLLHEILRYAVGVSASSVSIPLLRWKKDPAPIERAVEVLMRGLNDGPDLEPLERLVVTTASRQIASLMQQRARQWLPKLEDRPPEPIGASSQPISPPAVDVEFVQDDAELEIDELNRTAFAISVARRLHLVWRRLNVDTKAKEGEARGSFVLHLDAPWGGGKTTFANFVCRVLNPYNTRQAALFLRRIYGDDCNLAGIFACDPPADGAQPPKVPPDALRSWIVVEYNAWRAEHCSPPWWTFYESIRRAGFRSVLRHGDAPANLGQKAPRLQLLPVRVVRWLRLWACEMAWRLLTPRLLIPLAGFVLAALAAWVLSGAQVETVDPKIAKVVWSTGTVVGFMMAATATLTVLGGAASVLVASLAPGIDPLAERLGLGRSDPLERFRSHFHSTMARLRRPILVIVDDLDRCRPEVIVDLVRGMQTILRSPRVVFLLLGSRAWIERAFETVHKEMASAEIGEEQTVGARFVEKAIQMSFELPRMDDNTQAAYVSAKLGRGGTGSTHARASKGVREEVRRRAAEQPSAAFDAKALRAQARNDWASAKEYIREATAALRGSSAGRNGELSESEIDRLVGAQLDQEINEELGIQAASSAAVESEAALRLATLAPWLPSNPRQIKRIINAISLYTAAALQHPVVRTSGDRWFQLALWIVLRTEWPQTWRLLAACPKLADILASPEPLDELNELDPKSLPGSLDATRLQVSRILAEPRLMALIAKSGRTEGSRLDSEAITELLQLAAPNGGQLRLPEPTPG